MAEPCPEPPVPADADLRDFQFMPIDIVRLFGSTFHARANDAEWRAGVTLWLKSYHQVPAGSLPDNDVELCRLAELGRDMKTWKKLKPQAMHGWWIASDGRLYHSVVTEKVAEAWRRKGEQRVRTLKARIAAMTKRVTEAATDEERSHAQTLLQGLQQSLSQTLKQPVTDRPTGSATATKGQGQGQGQGQGDSKSTEEPKGSSGGKPPKSDAASKIFGPAVDWLQSVTGKSNGACRNMIGRWRRDLGDDDALLELVVEAQRQSIEGPESWFPAAIRERKKRQSDDDLPPRSADEVIAARKTDPRWQGVQ